jgi:pyridoxal phosphate enzyme (YggS family)
MIAPLPGLPEAPSGLPPLPEAEAVRLGAAYAGLRARIEAAARASGRGADSVTLLAVSKTFAAPVIAAAAALGQAAFGENYVQEALAKMERLAAAGIAGLTWHFIGPIQSNKTRAIAERFDWVQSLERESIARRLSDQRPAALVPLQVLLEVNVSAEASKSGIEPERLPALADAVAGLPRLALRGLMAIPQPGLAPAQQAAAFARMRALYDALRARHAGVDTLSMGMSADFEAAIAQGATLVRIGSALFGERK